MSKRKDGPARCKYTQEFKLEAVRQVKGELAVPATAKTQLGRRSRRLATGCALARNANSKALVTSQ